LGVPLMEPPYDPSDTEDVFDLEQFGESKWASSSQTGSEMSDNEVSELDESDSEASERSESEPASKSEDKRKLPDSEVAATISASCNENQNQKPKPISPISIILIFILTLLANCLYEKHFGDLCSESVFQNRSSSEIRTKEQ